MGKNMDLDKLRSYIRITEEVQPELGLDTEENETVILRMKVLLADLHVFAIKVHNFHWNITGPSFGPLHKLFDDVYGETQGRIDKVAERIRQVGGVATGSMKEFLDDATLAEEVGALGDSQEMLRKLVADLETLSRDARRIVLETESDQGTVNMFADMVEGIDKDAWFLRAHIQG